MAEVIFVGRQFNPLRLAGATLISVESKARVEQTRVRLTLGDHLDRDRTSGIWNHETIQVDVFALWAEDVLTMGHIRISREDIFDIRIGDRIAVLNRRLRQFVGVAQTEQNPDAAHERTEKFRAEQVVVGGVELLAIDDNGRLARIGQQGTCGVCDVIARLVGSHRGQSRQRIDDLHVPDADGEPLVIALDESNTDMLLIEADDLPSHGPLDFGDRVELYARVGGSQLGGEVVIDHLDAVGIRTGHVVLVAIIAVARLAVGSGEIERVRSRILDLGADDRRLGSRTCEPAPTEVHRRAKAAPWIARRSDACDRSVVDRIVVSNPQPQRGQGQRPSAGIGWIDQSVEVPFEGQCDAVEIRIVVHADGSERDVVAAVERVVGVDQLVINRLDRLGRGELIAVEVNINDVPQLLLGRPGGDHRLWHNGLDRRTEIQVEPNAS